MKPLSLLFAGLIGLVIGVSIPSEPVTITKTVPGKTILVPGPTITVHDPADAAEINRLAQELATAKDLAEKRLAGWLAAEARYLHYEKYWVPRTAAGSAAPAAASAAPAATSQLHPSGRIGRSFGGRR